MSKHLFAERCSCLRSAIILVAALLGVSALHASSVLGGAIDFVPAAELNQYTEVYRLAIPVTSPGWNTAGVLTGGGGYSVNNSASIPQGSFDRVAYYMELTGATNSNYPNGWIWVSFDAAGFTNRADRLGVPGTPTGAVFQQNLSNMTVLSNVAGIVTGTNIATGNIEFWPGNYAQANGRPVASGGPVPNANGATFDFGDTNSGGSGHGSMQIHNYDVDGAGPGAVGQTLFAYNAWGTVRVSELGIGNNPNGAQSRDWTISANADDTGAWTARTLQVFVSPVPEPSSIALLAIGGLLFTWRSRRKLAAA